MVVHRTFRIQIFALTFILISNVGLSSENRLICPTRYSDLFKTFTPLNIYEFRPKIGIELEGTAPHDIGLRGFAEIIRLSLLKKYPMTTIQFNTGRDSFALNEDEFRVKCQKTDGRKLIWTIKEDHSIRTNELPLEITSPILETPEDFDDFRKVVQSVQHAGARSHPESAGVHVHIDFSGAQGSDLAALAGLYAEIEKELKERFSTLATREIHIQNTSRALLREIKRNPLTSNNRSIIYDLMDSQDRLHSLNLHSYYKQQTVEFRLFNSTFNIDALKLMSDFTLKLVQGIRTQNPKLVTYLTESDKPIRLDELSEALDTTLHLPQAQVVLDQILRESQQLTKKPPIDLSHPQQRLVQRLAILLTNAAWVQELVNQAESLGGSNNS